MAKTRRLDSYPQSVKLLMGMLEDSPSGTITIPFESEKAAKAWRFDFYGYREAVKAHNPEWKTDFPLLQEISLAVITLKDLQGEAYAWYVEASIGRDIEIVRALERELSRQKALQQGATSPDAASQPERNHDGTVE